MNNVFRRAALDARISKHTLRVLDALLASANDRGETTLTISEIARGCVLPERTVCRALATLKESGYIARVGSGLVLHRDAA